MRPFCLRRLKSEVEVTLPPKVETRIAVPLSDQQIFWYRRWVLGLLSEREQEGAGCGWRQGCVRRWNLFGCEDRDYHLKITLVAAGLFQSCMWLPPS